MPTIVFPFADVLLRNAVQVTRPSAPNLEHSAIWPLKSCGLTVACSVCQLEVRRHFEDEPSFANAKLLKSLRVYRSRGEDRCLRLHGVESDGLLSGASRLQRILGGEQSFCAQRRLGTRCITFSTGLSGRGLLLLAASRLCRLPGGPQCLSVGYRLGTRCITFSTGLVKLMPQAAPAGFGGGASFSERRLLLAASRLCRLPGGLQCLSVGDRLGTRCITFPTGLIKLMPQATAAGFGGGAGFGERRLLLAASRLCGLPGGLQCLSVGYRLGTRCITFPTGLVKLMPQVAARRLRRRRGLQRAPSPVGCEPSLPPAWRTSMPERWRPPRHALHHVPGGLGQARAAGRCRRLRQRRGFQQGRFPVGCEPSLPPAWRTSMPERWLPPRHALHHVLDGLGQARAAGRSSRLRWRRGLPRAPLLLAASWLELLL